jgi:cell wall-associated NlpC family hydrolase
MAALLLSALSLFGMAIPAHADTTGNRIVSIARSQIGKPYVANTQGPNAFDCSGFTQWVIRKATGQTYVHSSRAQFRTMLRIPASKLRPGDLIFFFRDKAHHVGIYAGNGRIIHASNPRRGVVMDRLAAGWFRKHITGYARVLR